MDEGVLERMLSFLDLGSLNAAAMICRIFRDCCRRDSLWRLHYSLSFGVAPMELSMKPGDATSVYQLVGGARVVSVVF